MELVCGDRFGVGPGRHRRRDGEIGRRAHIPISHRRRGERGGAVRDSADFHGAGLLEPWLAVYVETDQKISEDNKNILSQNFKLVKELDGELITTQDINIINGLVRAAKENSVTQIIIGKSRKSKFQKFQIFRIFKIFKFSKFSKFQKLKKN